MLDVVVGPVKRGRDVVGRTKIGLCTAQVVWRQLCVRRGLFPHAGAGAGGEEGVVEMDRRMQFMERKGPG